MLFTNLMLKINFFSAISISLYTVFPFKKIHCTFFFYKILKLYFNNLSREVTALADI